MERAGYIVCDGKACGGESPPLHGVRLKAYDGGWKRWNGWLRIARGQGRSLVRIRMLALPPP